MGNHASSGERRQHKSDHYGSARMDGQAFNIEKHRAQQKQHLMSQMSDDESAPVIGKHSKLDGKDRTGSLPSRTRPIIPQEGNKKMLPCVLKYQGNGKEVAVAGSFNNWQALPMVKSEKDFVVIVDLPEGDHQYKFLVDGEWKLNESEKATSGMGTENNVISVKESDFEELENALLKDPNDKKESIYSGAEDATPKPDIDHTKDEYTQDIPEYDPNERRRGPPVLPPHLLQVILNKDTPVSCEPTLLPEPNHVMLNHMYALSIRDGMMVLSTSNRFKKKCVTTLIYRPI